MSNQSIGLVELIEKVKADLLTRSKSDSAPFLFVDSVELQLQVVVKKDAKTGLKVDVIGIGGVEGGANVGQQNVQTVKVSLSPLFSKEEIKEYYKTFRPEDVLPSINQSMKGAIKAATTKKAADEGSDGTTISIAFSSG